MSLLSNYISEEPKGLIIDDEGGYYLLKTVRWTKFIAIVSAVVLLIVEFLLFYALRMLSSSTSMYSQVFQASQVPLGFLKGWMIFMMLLLLVNIYPTTMLYRFSTLTKKGVTLKQQEVFNAGLKNLKNYFQFIGILLLIVIGAYALVILFWLVVGLVASM